MENNKPKINKSILAIISLVAALGVALLIYLFSFILKNDFVISPLGSQSGALSKIIEKPFDKYTVLNLEKYPAKPSAITKEKVLTDDPKYTSYLVSFKSDGKKVSGMMNIPKGSPSTSSGFPVIVMFRGYVDPKIYKTGVGTQRAAEVFVQNGFITFAPDFFGYGDSDKQSENVFAERFQTYTVALNALATVVNIENADSAKIGIWGHSNGGQISLTVLEATQKEYPTVLWAPVTKPFPYSVLYYTDESSDRGKFLRRELAKFEQDYNADLYAITDYVDRIKAPIQFHQGSADDAVPEKWSDEFAKKLEEAGVDVVYYTYPGSDHNLMPVWDTVVERNIAFYNAHFQ